MISILEEIESVIKMMIGRRGSMIRVSKLDWDCMIIIFIEVIKMIVLKNLG